MVDFYTKYNQRFEFYCKSSKLAIQSPPSKTRRRFTQKKKEEVRLHYSISGKIAQTAKTFGINESTVWGIIKLVQYQII